MEQMMTQAFRAALAKCQANNKYTVDTSFEEFADELTRDVFAILFPRTAPASAPVVESVRIPTVEDEAAVPKTKKKPGPKPKVDENGNPVPKKSRAKKAGGGGGSGSESESDSVVSVKSKTTEVKEVKEAPPAAPAPAPVVEEAKPKKPRAKKAPAPAPAAAEGPLNFDKFTPTDTKKLKAIATELSVEVDKKALLAYLNGLSKDAFNAKKVEDHFREFLTPKPAEAEEKDGEELDCIEIDFNKKTYLVDPATKRVYEDRDGVTVCVGHVGAGDFAKMVMPKDV